MRIFFLMTICIAMTVVQLKAQAHQSNLTVTCRISGMQADKWIYYFPTDGEINTEVNDKIDSVKSIEGGFVLHLNLPIGGRFYSFFLYKNYQYSYTDRPAFFQCYLEPFRDISIAGDGDFSNVHFYSSSPLTAEMNAFNDSTWHKLPASPKLDAKNRKEITPQQLKLAMNSAQLTVNFALSIYPDKIKHWVKKYPDSKLSTALLLTAQYPTMPIDTLRSLFKILTPAAKNCVAGKSLAAYIVDREDAARRSQNDVVDAHPIITIGKPVPDFTQQDTAGKPVTLRDFRGKYILIDFWASWCLPCRAENHYVLKAYKKYRNRNFTIISVSLDEAKSSWIKAIKQDGLPWKQVSDLLYHGNKIAQSYGVQSIPTNFLVGPDGVLIARNLRGNDLDQTLNKVLAKK